MGNCNRSCCYYCCCRHKRLWQLEDTGKGRGLLSTAINLRLSAQALVAAQLLPSLTTAAPPHPNIRVLSLLIVRHYHCLSHSHPQLGFPCRSLLLQRQHLRYQLALAFLCGGQARRLVPSQLLKVRGSVLRGDQVTGHEQKQET